MANLELKTASGGSVTLVPEDGVSNVTATVKHESGVLASEAHADFVAGVGRTWQDVTASRSVGVTYTNNTGRDIFVSAKVQGGNNAASELEISGLRVSREQIQITGVYTNTHTGLVPTGATYLVAGSVNLLSWHELR